VGQFSVDLSGRVALVTGVEDRVGRAVAVALAGAGAAVCVQAVNPDRANRVVEVIESAGGRAMDWTADVSNRFQVAAMIEALRDRLGGLHLLVNVASVDKQAPMLLLDEYDWRRVIEINLTGTFFCIQLASRVMVAEGGGAIVNVASPAGTHPDSIAYRVSRSGLIGLTREAARALAGQGVRVNAVCPQITSETVEPARIAQPAQIGTPDDIAAVVLFLCSEAASSVTGQIIAAGEGG
jgi:NAD(P)-dependent dehydrogenase (short-subunit alcohol dehydrogenase family)